MLHLKSTEYLTLKHFTTVYSQPNIFLASSSHEILYASDESSRCVMPWPLQFSLYLYADMRRYVSFPDVAERWYLYHGCSIRLNGTYDSLAPHGWEGYICKLFCLEACLPICQRIAKYIVSIDHLYQKYIAKGYVCQFWCQTYLFRFFYFSRHKTSAHQCWPLQTSLDSFWPNKLIWRRQ